MATNQKYHYLLDGLGFMLSRQPNGGRAWKRSGVADIPTRRSADDARYGNVADTLDHPEVWDDWSGGFGERYRRDENPNAVTWSINFDLRFPRQAIHSQAPQLLTNVSASLAAKFRTNAQWFIDIPLPNTADPPPGAGAVLALGKGYITAFTPKDNYDALSGAVFDVAIEMSLAALNFGRRPAIYGSYVFIPNTDGSAIYRRDIGSATYTLGASATLGTATWFGVAAQQMWYSPFPNRLRAFVSAEGNLLEGAGLGATINVGNGYSRTRDGVALENQMYVGMADGIYQGNVTGTFNNVLNEIGVSVDPDNCAAFDTFEGGVIAAAGPHIWWYKPSTIQSTLREVGPQGLGVAPMRPNGPLIRGKFTCVTSYGPWVYAGLFTGSGSVFMAGVDASPGLPYVWYPLHDFRGLNVKVSMIHVDQITTSSGGKSIPNRIWAATDASWGAAAGATAPMFYWEIPTGDQNPLLDTTFIPNFMGSAAMDMAISDWGAPATAKLWRQNQVWGDGVGISTLSSTSQFFCNLYYAVDPAASANVYLLGQVPPAYGLASTARFDTFFPATQGSFATGQVLKMRIESFNFLGNGGLVTRGNLTSPGVYRAVVNRGVVLPELNETIEAHTRIADKMMDVAGAQMRPGGVQLQQLRDRAQGSAPSLLTDLAGNNYWVKVLGPVEESEVFQEGMQNPEVDAMVRMAVLSYSAGTVI